MSTPLALAAITAILRGHVANWIAEQHLSAHLGSDILVSALPPDRIPTGADERPQINLFLYAVTPNTALRVDEHRSASQRSDRSRFSLDLHYLVSAYGATDLQIETLLGYTIHAIQQVPSLEPDVLQSMLAKFMLATDSTAVPRFDQVDVATLLEGFKQLTIQPHFLSIEEMFRIWSSLQARYRPSAAYRVSAVMVAAP